MRAYLCEVFRRGTPEWDNGIGPMRIYASTIGTIFILVEIVYFTLLLSH